MANFRKELHKAGMFANSVENAYENSEKLLKHKKEKILMGKFPNKGNFKKCQKNAELPFVKKLLKKHTLFPKNFATRKNFLKNFL
jgi:hypothetical protein